MFVPLGMEALDLLTEWRNDAAKLCSVKDRLGWIEITLPYSTLTDMFIRVYARVDADGRFTVSDLADLSNDEYDVRDNLSAQPFLRAQELLDRGHYSNIYKSGVSFVIAVKSKDMLTSALHDMAEFIQLSVNTAVLHEQRHPVTA